MKKTVSFFTCIGMLALGASVAGAYTLNVNTNNSSTWNVYSIATWATTGNLMDGMSVTAYLEDAQGGKVKNELFWQDNVGVSSLNYGWSVFMNGFDYNTWDGEGSFSGNDAQWNVVLSGNYSLTKLVFDGDVADPDMADVVFDRIFSPFVTPDSALGREIEWVNGPGSLVVSAEYSNQVSVNGTVYTNSNLEPDLYRTLTLSFGTGDSGFLAPGETFVFRQDTDNANVSVPEPATMLLMGLGLSGLVGGAVSRKRRRSESL